MPLQQRGEGNDQSCIGMLHFVSCWLHARRRPCAALQFIVKPRGLGFWVALVWFIPPVCLLPMYSAVQCALVLRDQHHQPLAALCCGLTWPSQLPSWLHSHSDVHSRCILDSTLGRDADAEVCTPRAQHGSTDVIASLEAAGPLRSFKPVETMAKADWRGWRFADFDSMGDNSRRALDPPGYAADNATLREIVSAQRSCQRLAYLYCMWPK